MTEATTEQFDSEADYRAAIDAVIRSAKEELRIFDADLRRMAFDEPERIVLLTDFLKASADNRLKIVVHDSLPLRKDFPRLQVLMRNHGNAIAVRHTPDHLLHIADRFVLADELHGAIRFHADHPRGKRIMNDKTEIHPWWQRFEDLWEASQPCHPASTVGL